MWTHFKSAICKTRNQKSLWPTTHLSCYDQVKWSHNLLPVKSSQLPVGNKGSLIKAVDDGMKKLVNKMKNKDRETIFIFSSDNGAVQIFDNPDKVRGLRTHPLWQRRLETHKRTSILMGWQLMEHQIQHWKELVVITQIKVSRITWTLKVALKSLQWLSEQKENSKRDNLGNFSKC